jgi:hypothetical protein
MIRLNDASNHVSTSQGIPRTVSVVVPATLVAIGIAIFCMVIFSITSMHMVLSPAMGAVAEYSKDMKMDAFETAQTRTLNQLYEDNYVIISAPPVSVCQSEFQTNTIACMWYPIVLKWYKIISSGPRFFIYNYTLGGAFSVNNFGIFQATNFPSMTRPWDYFQAIALLAAPALGIAIAAVIMGLLFYLGCSLTCCCCCCGKGFGCGKKKMSFGTKLAAKLCMLAVAVVVSFGLFLEFSGYTLWRQAITDFFDILIKKITFANDKSKELQVQLDRMDTNYTSGPPPAALDTVELVFSKSLEYITRAKGTALCAQEVPGLVATNWQTLNYNSYWQVFLSWIIYNFGCIDLWWFIFLIVIHSVVVIAVLLGLLAILIQRPFPALLMAWIIFLCIILAMLIFLINFPLSILISDVCSEIDLLEVGQGSNTYLNQYNPPKFIVECQLQSLLDTIEKFISDSLTTAKAASDEAQAVINNNLATTAQKEEAASVQAASDTTYDALQEMNSIMFDFFDCDHWKELYLSLKTLLCFTINNAMISQWNGAGVVGLALIPGFLVAMFCFAILRPDPEGAEGDDSGSENEKEEDDGGNFNGSEESEEEGDSGGEDSNGGGHDSARESSLQINNAVAPGTMMDEKKAMGATKKSTATKRRKHRKSARVQSDGEDEVVEEDEEDAA